MCLITYQRKPKITKKDMVVFKEIRENCLSERCSIYYTHLWRRNKLYTRSLGVKRMKYALIDGLLEFFDKECMDFYEEDIKKGKQYTSVSEGFHAALTEDRLFVTADSPPRKFLIPKGSEYYLDATGLIVANQMKML